MTPNPISVTFDIGEGLMVTIETGKLARQADGAVTVRLGDCVILATVVANKEPKEGQSFFPLTVDYQEKFASAGRFPGGFFKREARLNDYEILTSRLVDRALRPLFPDDYHADTQVLISLISGDKNTMPDALACLAASAAITVSDIPFNGPVSEVRVGKVDGKLIANPTVEEIAKGKLDMIIAATEKDIMMVEGEMKEISEAEMLEAIKFAHEVIRLQIKAINEFKAKVEASKGKIVKREYSHETNDAELKERVHKALYDGAYAVAKSQNPNKKERGAAFKA